MTKNILIITADQWRGDCLGCGGNPVIATPNIDALALDGVRFAQHYSPSTPCGPSRATFLTGMYPHNHRSITNGTPLNGSLTNIALEMRKGGYDPMLFGYTDVTPDPRYLAKGDPSLHSYEGVLPGFTVAERLPEDGKAWLSWLRRQGYDIGISGVEEIYRAQDGEEPRVTRPARYKAEHSETAWMTDRVIDHLRFVEGEPFCFHVSYLRPHPPYIAPEPYNNLYDPAHIPPPVRADSWEREAEQHPYHSYIREELPHKRFVKGAPDGLVTELSLEEVQRIRSVYYGMISEVDSQIGRLIACLKQENIYEDTLIIFTSDHGDLLGDHFMFSKENYFDPCFHIPLIIKQPQDGTTGLRSETAVEAFTESIDLMPTILDLCELEIPSQCDGRSLRPFLEGLKPDGWRDEVYTFMDFRDVEIQRGETHFALSHDECSFMALRDRDYKYVHFAGLPPALYDLRNDPGELHNLASNPDYHSVQLDYAQKLLSWRMRNEYGALDKMKATPKGVVVANGSSALRAKGR